jgi:uncharacterized membrane protein HdeD (DUF308 family)
MKGWYWRVLFGIVLLVFGLIALVFPIQTAATLVIFIGAFLIVAGIFLLLGGATAKEMGRLRWIPVLEGLLSLIVGIMFIVFPGWSLVALLFLFAAWMLVWGVFEITGGLIMPEGMSTLLGKYSRGLYVFMGIFSIILAFLLFAFPGDGIIALTWVIGIYAIIIGVISIVDGGSRAKG